MLANMASSLIVHKRITTTLAKAKALRSYVEPLITKSKDDATHSRRVVFSYLNDKVATAELFREVSPKVADRPGGYTRIIKLGTRLGDSADMAMIELVDFNELLVKDAKPKKARRSRRGGSGSGTAAPVAAAPAAVVEEKVKEAPKAEVVEEAPAVEETPKAATDARVTDAPADKEGEEGEEKKDA